MSNGSGTSTAFTGSVPDLYDSYLVPMIFEYYARDLTQRQLDLVAGAAANVVDRAVTVGAARPVCRKLWRWPIAKAHRSGTSSGRARWTGRSATT